MKYHLKIFFYPCFILFFLLTVFAVRPVHAAAIETKQEYNAGDIVCFGCYEQDNNTENGPEKIEWIVLQSDSEGYLLISRYALDCKIMGNRNTNSLWDNSDLRSWLNSDFLSEAFDEGEQQNILLSENSADYHTIYKTYPGQKTSDKVFCLSEKEALEYFETDESRMCTATPYAQENGAWISEANGSCWWWLRTPCNNAQIIAVCNTKGRVGVFGRFSDGEGVSVRPAIRVKSDFQPAE